MKKQSKKTATETPIATEEQVAKAVAEFLNGEKFRLNRPNKEMLSAAVLALLDDEFEFPDDCIQGPIANKVTALQSRVDALTRQVVELSALLNAKAGTPKHTAPQAEAKAPVKGERIDALAVEAAAKKKGKR